MSQHVSYAEAAVILGVSERTVSNFVRKGALVSVAMMNTRGQPVARIRRSEVEALRDKRRAEPQQ